MPVFKSSRKVQRFGSSLAITIPALFVKANEVEKGDVIYVVYGLEGVLVASLFKDPEVLSQRLKDLIKGCFDKGWFNSR